MVFPKQNNVFVTPKMLSGLANAVQLGNIIQATPFRWNKTLDRMEKLETSDVRYKIWILGMIVVHAYIIYVGFRLFYMLTYEDLTVGETMRAAAIFAYYLMIPMIFATIIVQRDNYHKFIERARDYFSAFNDEFVLQNASSPVIKTCENFIRFCTLAFYLNGLVFWLHSVVYTRSVEAMYPVLEWVFLSCGLLEWEHSEKMCWITSAACNAYILLQIIPSGTMIVVGLFNTFFPTIAVIKELRKSNENGITSPKVHEWKNRFQSFKSLVIIVTELNNIYAYTIAAAEVIIIVLAVFSAYNGIRIGGFTGVVSAIGGTGMLAFWILLFNFCADFQSESSRTISEWERESGTDSKGIRKQVRAYRPLHISVGSYFFVDKMIVFTLCKIVFDNTVNILMIT